MKLNPLFLSAAIDSASNEQYPAHSAPDCAVEAFDNSSPAAASGTKRRSSDSVSQTSPKSHAQCDPTSSNLQHIHWHTHPFSKPWSIDAAEPLTSNSDDVAGAATWAWAHAPPAANDKRSAVLHRPVGRPHLDRSPVSEDPGHAPDGLPIVGMFQMVSCPYYCTNQAS